MKASAMTTTMPVEDTGPQVLQRLFDSQATTALALRSSTARERS